jgi:replication factor C subunit 1
MQSILTSGKFQKLDRTLTSLNNPTILKAFPANNTIKLLIGSECNDGRPITESWRYKQAKALGIPIIIEKKLKRTVANDESDAELFVDKYKPKSLDDIIGHKEQIKLIIAWLESWNYPKEFNDRVSRGEEKRAILVTGPPGIGKTSTVHLLAKELGYKVTEYNASDVRSISMLRGLIALGVKRLQKEVIVMDEVDELSERGGVGEIAAIIKKTNVPIICIANEKPPKLKPIITVCHDVKFNRPVKSTIATQLLKIIKTEGLEISKAQVEELCEKNGNDIRSILNMLQFYGNDTMDQDNNTKDSLLRLDLFSATQKLMSNKKLKISDADDLVYVDYNMVPLMVQEAYVTAGRDSMDDLERAADLVSNGDLINTQIDKAHDWSLLPHLVTNTTAIAKTVSGPAPFQIFPQLLGKQSKMMKHQRWMETMARVQSLTQWKSSKSMRLDYAAPIQRILLTPLKSEKPDIKGAIQRMSTLKVTRDDLFETLNDVSFDKCEVATKVKTALTREWNKTQKGSTMIKTLGKRKSIMDDIDDIDDIDEDLENQDDLEEEMERLEI